MEELKEEWRDIQGYEGYYQVSNLGRVKSVDRTIIRRRLGVENTLRMKGRIRKIVSLKQNNYYCNVMLSKESKMKMCLVHRLVAQAFIPNPNPELYNEVDHINRDVTDNSVTNLRWIDRTGNIRNQQRCIEKRNRLQLQNIQDKIKDAMELFDL